MLSSSRVTAAIPLTTHLHYRYPHEKEITFQPLSAICVEGTRVQGNTLVIEARLNVNLTSLTIEQEVAKMKSSHTKMLDLIIDDLKHAGAPPWSLVTLEGARHLAARRLPHRRADAHPLARRLRRAAG